MPATLWVFVSFTISASISSTATSQTETPTTVRMASAGGSSALSADVNFRKRELEKNPMNAEARAQLAVALERKKDYQGMVDLLADYKDKIGRSGLILLARAYGKLDRQVEEITTLELANARYAKDANLQTLFAGATARIGRHEQAIEMYYKAKEYNPKYIPAYDGLIAELIKTESRQEARDLLSDMMKKFGAKPRWVSELCNLYVLDAFHEKSVETCTRAMKVDPSNPMNAVHLGRAYTEQGNPDKAKSVLIKTAMKIRKSEPVQSALGAYFMEKKNYIDAFRWYKAGVKNDPKSYNAQLGLAQAALELQKMEESLAAFISACKINRTASREFQSGLIRIRNRNDSKWKIRFEEAISNHCQVSI